MTMSVLNIAKIIMTHLNLLLENGLEQLLHLVKLQYSINLMEVHPN